MVNLAERLNKQSNTDEFCVVRLEGGPVVNEEEIPMSCKSIPTLQIVSKLKQELDINEYDIRTYGYFFKIRFTLKVIVRCTIIKFGLKLMEKSYELVYFKYLLTKQ